jgi:hypothetical protein
MSPQQSELPGMPEPVRGNPQYDRLKDYVGVFPPKVMPTRHLDVLEENGHLLFIVNMAHGQESTQAQRRIWRLMVRLGELDEAPGTVSVWLVWGVGDLPRIVQKIDYLGDHPPDRLTQQGFREELATWWKSH